jgi:hypothetical protein
MGARTKLQVGLRGTKEHCDTLFRDATGVRQMTRADLTEEVCHATEMPRKESDGVVCAIFDGIVRALGGDLLAASEIAGVRVEEPRQMITSLLS